MEFSGGFVWIILQFENPPRDERFLVAMTTSVADLVLKGRLL